MDCFAEFIPVNIKRFFPFISLRVRMTKREKLAMVNLYTLL
jgi:hypothetical protein